MVETTSWASKTACSVSASSENGYSLSRTNFSTPSSVSGAMATTRAPALRKRSMSSRNCERWRRQNGQPNPRRNTSTTGPVAIMSDSRTVSPCWSTSARSGAFCPTAAVVLCTLTAGTLRRGGAECCAAGRTKDDEHVPFGARLVGGGQHSMVEHRGEHLSARGAAGRQARDPDGRGLLGLRLVGRDGVDRAPEPGDIHAE